MPKNPSTYPVTIDSTLQTDRRPGDLITSNSYDVIEDAIYNLENKVGIDNSPVSTSLDYKLANHSHSGSDSINIDHGVALSGLLDNDHPQYSLSGHSHALPFSAMDEPTGFLSPNDPSTSLSLVQSIRTVVLSSETTDSFEYYIDGTSYSVVSAGVSATFPNTTGQYNFRITSSGVLVSAAGAFDFEIPGNPYVCTVYWDATAGSGLLGNERHGLAMDWATHAYLHNTVGARYQSGLTCILTSSDAITAGAGYFHDEDIVYNLAQQTTCQVLYRRADLSWMWTAPQASFIYKASNIIQYDNNGTVTDVTNNSRVAYWIFATNSVGTPIISLMGQRQDVTLFAARANNTYESLSFGTLFYQEMKLLYRVILRRTGTSETVEDIDDYRTVSSAPGTYVATSHSSLTGLLNDDHTQYLLADGTRALTDTLTATSISAASVSATFLQAMVPVQGQVALKIGDFGSSTTNFEFRRHESTGSLEIQGNQTGYNTVAINPSGGRLAVGSLDAQEQIDNYNASHVRIQMRSLSGLAGISLRASGASGENTWYIDNRGENDPPYARLQVYSPGAYQVFAITSGGNVGIGTNNPTARLSLRGDYDGGIPEIDFGADDIAAPSSGGTNSNGDRLVLWESGGDKYAIGMEASTVWFQTGAYFKWYVNTDVKFMMTNTGAFTGDTISANTFSGAPHTIVFCVPSTASTGTNSAPSIIMPYSATIIKAYGYARTAPSGAALIFDINKNGSTIWSTQANRLTVSADSTTGVQTSFNTTSLAENDRLDLDIDQVGSSTAGSDITVEIKVQT